MTAVRQPFVTSAELEAQCAALSAVGVGPSGTPQDLVDTALESATELMWHLTGRQFGLWTETVRPYLAGEPVYRLELGEYPVTSVQEVRIDGATLPTSAYWVADDRFVVLSSGGQWPSTQLQHLPNTDVGTFSITYTWGVAPPPAVRSGARRLACELLAMSTGGGSSLSDRVRSVSRQGTSFELVSPQDLLESNGRTGIYEVDLAISAYNSGGNVAPPVVLSPDSFLGGGSVPTGSGATQGPPGGVGATGPAGPPGSSAADWSVVYTTTLPAAASSVPITGVENASRWRVHIITRSTSTGGAPTELRMQMNTTTGAEYEWVQMASSNNGGTYTARNDAATSTTNLRVGLVTQTAAATQRYASVTAETVRASGMGTFVYVNSSFTSMHSNNFEVYEGRISGAWHGTTNSYTIEPVLTLASGQFAAGTSVQVLVLSA